MNKKKKNNKIDRAFEKKSLIEGTILVEGVVWFDIFLKRIVTREHTQSGIFYVIPLINNISTYLFEYWTFYVLILYGST